MLRKVGIGERVRGNADGGIIPDLKMASLPGSDDRAGMSRILVVERDRQTAERLGQPLDRAGWTIVIAEGAARARSILFDDRVGLALVRLGLTNGDARELCREIRAGGGPPVILVGGRSQEPELIAGLQSGADDYLVEPVRTAELLARVGAAMRRATAGAQPTPRRRQIGPLTIDPARRMAAVASEPLSLTPHEYALLLTLANRPGEVVTRDEILTTVWGSGWLGTSKVVDVQISGLRRKLSGGGEHRSLIHTIRGVGFRLAPPDDGDQDFDSRRHEEEL